MTNPLSQEIEDLLEALKNGNDTVREAAAEELGKLKIKDERIINALTIVARSDRNKYVKGAAEEALFTLGQEPPSMIEEVVSESKTQNMSNIENVAGEGIVSKQEILNRLRNNQNRSPSDWNEWTPQDQNYKLWCQLAHEHFVNELAPNIQRSGETIFDYWPATFYWGMSERYQRHTDSDRTYVRRIQSAARGYICITNSSTYFVLRKQITTSYPIDRPGCLQNMFSIGFRDEANEIRREEVDSINTISHRSIRGVETSNNVIILYTTSDAWEIVSLFNSDERQNIYIALSMASQRQLTLTVDKPTLKQSQDKSGLSSEIKNSLKVLTEMKAEGLITEEEYEAKRKELLNRL